VNNLLYLEALSQVQTLFVTGATGLVGSQVVLEALTRDYKVRALVRSRDPNRPLVLPSHPNLELVPGDLNDSASWVGALRGVDVVVHAGAMVGDSGKADDYFRTNVSATLALLHGAKNAKTVRRIILVSSLGVYHGRDHFGSDENVAINREGLDAYTRSKAECELRFLEEAKILGVSAVAIRPGFIYGPRDRTVVPRLLQRLAVGSLVYFGGGERKTNCIYVKNLSYGIFLAMDAENDMVNGLAFNLTDDPTATKREFLESLSREAGLPAPRASIPRPVALTLAEISEFAARIGLVKQPPVSKAAFKFLGLNLHYSIARARKVLGYKPPYGYADGIKETIAWFRETGAIPLSKRGAS